MRRARFYNREMRWVKYVAAAATVAPIVIVLRLLSVSYAGIAAPLLLLDVVIVARLWGTGPALRRGGVGRRRLLVLLPAAGRLRHRRRRRLDRVHHLHRHRRDRRRAGVARRAAGRRSAGRPARDRAALSGAAGARSSAPAKRRRRGATSS